MNDLFLKSECDGSIIKDDKSTSKRKELDPERVSIIKCNKLIFSFFIQINYFFILILFKKDCVFAKMNKYGLTDQRQTWDTAVKIINRYCIDSDSETT